MSGGERVMLHEACRLADRLDRFDKILRGDASTWATIRDRDGNLELMINTAASEARQTAGQLRQYLVALGQVRAPGDDAKGAEPVDDPLAAARAARSQRLRDAGAAGS